MYPPLSNHWLRPLVAFSVALAPLGCQHNERELQLPPERQQFSFEELSTTQLQEADIDLSPKPSRNQKRSSACVRAISKSTASLQTLRPLLEKSQDPSSLAFRMAELSPAHCAGPALESTAKLFRRAAQEHAGVLGVILPMSGKHAELAKATLDGIKALRKQDPALAKVRLELRDSEGEPEKALKGLADLVFNYNVSLVIGGLSKDEAAALAPLAKGLRTPMLIVNRDDTASRQPLALQLFPNDRDIALGLVQEAKTRGFKRIAMLLPEGGKSAQVGEAFKAEVEKAGLTLTLSHEYIPGDFASMNEAVAQVAGTDPNARPEEFRELLQEMQGSSGKKTIDPRQVILPPKLVADAVFLPDHFRIVHHFIKLFRYHGVEKLPLIGTSEWRSANLLQPWQDFLEGSYFADFLGSYQELPASLRPRSADSTLFVNNDLARKLDFQWIGYRAAQAALPVLAQEPRVQRRFLFRKLQEGNSHGVSFTPEGSSSWPTYIFTIAEEGAVSWLPAGAQAAPVPEATRSGPLLR